MLRERNGGRRIGAPSSRRFPVRRFLLAALLVPTPLVAQAPIRLPAGACNWQSRADAVWGAAIRSYSSQYDASSWAATQALGLPDVWPRYGDIPGAWAPSSPTNLADYFEVTFPQPLIAGEVWVFETNGAGGVYAVSAINLDGSTTPLAVSTPARLDEHAAQLVVPVEPPRAIAGVRIATSSAVADTYSEVDAVAALPARMCSAGQLFLPAAAGLRMAPGTLASPLPPGAVWASGVARFTSQYSTSGWAATQALGPPDVFPQHGDLTGTWAPATTTAIQDFLVVQFAPTMAQEIWIYETYGVGGLWLVEDMSSGTPVALWADAPGPASLTEARLLRITLPQPRSISALRLVTSPRAVQRFTEIDAVALGPAGAGVVK